MRQTASITNLTASGGFFIALTSTMSPLLRLSRALMAPCKAGMALSRSAWQSAAIFDASAACWLHKARSLLTTASTSFASLVSTAILSKRASVSIVACFNFGCKATSSVCMPSTCASVDKIFSRPLSYRSLRSMTSLRWAPSSFLKVLINSR